MLELWDVGSAALRNARGPTYHGVSLFQVLFVENVLARVSLRHPLPVWFGGGNLLLGQHISELGGSINRHFLAQRM